MANAALLRASTAGKAVSEAWARLGSRGLLTSAALQHSGDVIKPEGHYKVTVIPGDGVGPELMNSVREVFKAAAVPVELEEHHLSEVQDQASGDRLNEVVKSLDLTRVALKGKLYTPMEHKGDLASYEMKLRRRLDLFANVVRCKSLPGFTTRHNNLDLVVIREQTEGEYSSLEHESVPGVVESLKIITRDRSRRIAKFAFDYATKHGRSKVTAVHKANIMKLGDGLFLQCCEEVAALYPLIKYDTIIIDNCCMQGARHPFAQALGRNIANPTAILLSSSNMLRHLHMEYHANMIYDAVRKVIKTGKVRTADMGGYASTTEFTRNVISTMET
ncbi:isocitrate dehydrogenase [NAD] subunit beta, mitochondrial isoform X3 [Petromyzon marinus]|uniref:Isocitrate dehydrogenase [NAD] subunit beta, mitochondrial isoform X4 n=1 Tax=Petromyzon marinus TaxID=7757 RepID=A0AAJ7UGL7_PETMA|nr:isocitrate dehydrogenase [NAD] subunit beta, mitochondrial isoform X4 [Petromyzon marinus]